MTHTVESLRAFTERVKDAFLAKQIRAPVHLAAGNERELLDIFRQVRPDDWVFSTWRSSYHALLKGIPADELFEMIRDGRSMYVCSAPHRFLSSAIVGGALPIACGVAMAIKRAAESRHFECKVCGNVADDEGMLEHGRGCYMLSEDGGGDEYIHESVAPRVWCFVGDMCARTGLYHETIEYAKWHDLPMQFVVEDNRYSTETPTAAVWGDNSKFECTHCYRYEREFPHVGVGKNVVF